MVNLRNSFSCATVLRPAESWPGMFRGPARKPCCCSVAGSCGTAFQQGLGLCGCRLLRPLHQAPVMAVGPQTACCYQFCTFCCCGKSSPALLLSVRVPRSSGRKWSREALPGLPSCSRFNLESSSAANGTWQKWAYGKSLTLNPCFSLSQMISEDNCKGQWGFRYKTE